MKILIIAQHPFWPENKDGVNKILYNLMIHNSFFKADFISLYGTQEALPKQIIKQQVSQMNLIQKSERKAFKLFRWIFSFRPFMALAEKNTKKAASIVNQSSSKYDKIVIVGFQLSSLVQKLSEKKKIIFLPIDSPSLLFKSRLKSEQNYSKKIIWFIEKIKAKKLERMIYPLSTVNILVSDKDLEHAQRISPTSQFEFIPNGVNLKEFKYKDPIHSNFNSILFSGNFSYGPNILAANFLINHVLPLLLKKNSDLKIIFAGSNVPQSLKKYQSKHVFFTGYVDSMAKELYQSPLYVSPIFYGAGIKNKILEAMATGRIILGSDLSFSGLNFKSFSPHQIIHTNDPKEWAHKIISILNDFSKGIKFPNQSYEIISSSFSWENRQSRYFEAFKQSPLLAEQLNLKSP